MKKNENVINEFDTLDKSISSDNKEQTITDDQNEQAITQEDVKNDSNTEQNNNKVLSENSENQIKHKIENPDYHTFTGEEERRLARGLVRSFDSLKRYDGIGLDEIKEGRHLSYETQRIRKHNESVAENGSGDIIEVRGNREENTLSAVFEKPDGSLATEIVSSTTPPHITDREEFYNDQEVLWGEKENPGPVEEESSSDNESSEALPYVPPKVYAKSARVTNDPDSDEDMNNPPSNPGSDMEFEDFDSESEKSMDKGKEIESDSLKRKRSDDTDDEDEDDKGKGSLKKTKIDDTDDEDENDKGKGSGFGGSSSMSGSDTTGGISSAAGPSNFRIWLNDFLFILYSSIVSILENINDIFTLM